MFFLVDEVVNGTPHFASQKLLQHQKFSSEKSENQETTKPTEKSAQ